MANMIRYVQIFGERCSGTNYLAALVRKNFPDVELTQEFGGKHWFIRGHGPRGRANSTTDHQCVRTLDDSDNTLFLVIHRNPFDWVRSIQATPYHAWTHDSLPLDEFIRKSWVSSEVAAVNPTWEVREDGYYFIEEAENVLALRTSKMRHFLGLNGVVPHVVQIRYEDLAADPGLLATIAENFEIRLDGLELQNTDRYFGGKDKKVFDGPREYAPINESNREFINRHLDWDVESLVGYSPSDYRG
jgi:hypothetical protein